MFSTQPVVYSLQRVIGKAIQRLFIADNTSPSSRNQIALMEAEYDMDGAFDKLSFGIICFGLHEAGQIAMLKRFLEDPETILPVLETDQKETSQFEGLASILHRGKVKWDHQALISSTEHTHSIFHALNCDKDPLARSWYHSFISRRYFRTSRGYLGLGLHHIRPGVAYT